MVFSHVISSQYTTIASGWKDQSRSSPLILAYNRDNRGSIFHWSLLYIESFLWLKTSKKPWHAAAMYAMAAMNAMRTAEKAGDWRMAMELLKSMCHFDILKGLRVVSKSFRFIALLLVIRNPRKNEKKHSRPFQATLED